MMQHPRLMKLVHREVNFDRYEYTQEEKQIMTKIAINLSKKEEKEIKDGGVELCPKTIKELYTHIRASE